MRHADAEPDRAPASSRIDREKIAARIVYGQFADVPSGRGLLDPHLDGLQVRCGDAARHVQEVHELAFFIQSRHDDADLAVLDTGRHQMVEV